EPELLRSRGAFAAAQPGTRADLTGSASRCPGAGVFQTFNDPLHGPLHHRYHGGVHRRTFGARFEPGYGEGAAGRGCAPERGQTNAPKGAGLKRGAGAPMSAHDPGPIGPRQTDIAIIGMAGRFPGPRTLDEFWENLKTGFECIS